MLIVAQSGKCVYNMDDLSKIHIDGTGRKCVAVSRNGSGGCVGEYERAEQAEAVLGMFASAYAGEEKIFEFPSRDSVNGTMRHGSHVTTKETRHGGS